LRCARQIGLSSAAMTVSKPCKHKPGKRSRITPFMIVD
jgi:hypothetical protein